MNIFFLEFRACFSGDHDLKILIKASDYTSNNVLPLSMDLTVTLR